MFSKCIPNPPDPPIKLDTLYKKAMVYFTVTTPLCAVRLSKERDNLQTPPPFSGSSGQIVAFADRQIGREWFGDIWALGDPTNPVNAYLEVDIGDSPTNP